MIVYLAHELAIALMLALMLEVCSHRGHTREGASLRSLRTRLYGMSATLAVCIVMAWLANLYWVAASPILVGAIERHLRSRKLNLPKQQSLR